jgi:phosphoglycolate phosphatase-like HAD superfamily hydrolase
MSRPLPCSEPILGAALDLDGVLVDGMPYHFPAFDKALKMFGVHSTIRDIGLLEGMRTRELIKRVANSYNAYPTENELDEAEQVKRKLYSQIFRPTLMNGAEELVALLAERGCRLAIVTGTAEESARAVIRELHAENLFEVVISHDSGIPMKPHPAPYATSAYPQPKKRECAVLP